MIAAILKNFDTLALEEVPTPTPKAGEVLVRVKACGICATDYKAYRGIRRNVTFPTILGHEPSGIVAAIGSGVRHFKEGDEVIVAPIASCGVCAECRVGNNHYCKNNWCYGGDGPEDVRDGAFAEYMIVEEQVLYPKPKGISFDAAALTEPLAGAWKGMILKSEMHVGDDVVVIGTGGIGLLCLMVARAAGAGRLIAVDSSAYARDNAMKLGATHAVDPMSPDVVKQIYGIIPDGPDVVLEAAGPIEAVELMVALRRRGTKWNIFGITTHETFSLDGGYTHFLEGRMDSSFGCTPLGMQNAIRLMERGV
ncbi:MAG: alcohol dehydrogenase catalytic domain-containing protein, partial [Kiritimatiellaeota bacterium]|nr:alcohol dehydrogenase catalytic domain-containing protein [Kiritimatiellota bacterium]